MPIAHRNLGDYKLQQVRQCINKRKTPNTGTFGGPMQTGGFIFDEDDLRWQQIKLLLVFTPALLLC